MALFGNTGQRVARGRHAAVPAGTFRKGSAASTVVFTSMLVVGACLLAYPALSDWWNSVHQTRAIASYERSVERSDPHALAEMLDDARAYNARLFDSGAMRMLTDAELDEYAELLDVDGTGVMCYVRMGRLGINAPVYHGVDETTLQVALGHLAGSSLPVGGASTHAVIAGHRGLPSARLFSDLDKAREGDTFTIAVLGEVLTYEVDQIRVVLPDDLSGLAITEGADLVTLLTCTPYGVNTHRLLVRGHRVDAAPAAHVVETEAVRMPNYLAVFVVGELALFVFLVGSLRIGTKNNDKSERGAGHVQD